MASCGSGSHLLRCGIILRPGVDSRKYPPCVCVLLQSETTKDSAWLLFDTALLNSGFQMDDPKEFSGRMFHLMQQYVCASVNELKA